MLGEDREIKVEGHDDSIALLGDQPDQIMICSGGNKPERHVIVSPEGIEVGFVRRGGRDREYIVVLNATHIARERSGYRLSTSKTSKGPTLPLLTASGESFSYSNRDEITAAHPDVMEIVKDAVDLMAQAMRQDSEAFGNVQQHLVRDAVRVLVREKKLVVLDNLKG